MSEPDEGVKTPPTDDPDARSRDALQGMEAWPTEPYYSDSQITLHHGDCLDVLRSLPNASVDAVVTDPPYGLEFMGKAWDSFGKDTGAGYAETPRFTDRGDASPLARTSGPNHFRAGAPFQRWCELWAIECLRVLKPGGHMLAFGGTRTFHRLACAIEDAGFEVRDSIAWLYGSGFPKSLDVSKAIDKAAGAEREASGLNPWAGRRSVSLAGRGSTVAVEGGDFGPTPHLLTAPATPDAERWQGWGTALKPAFEPVVVGRKPLAGTVAANVLAHGTGALNIDGCRIEGEPTPTFDRFAGGRSREEYRTGTGSRTGEVSTTGRWPANVILDESQAAELDEQSGTLTSGTNPTRRGADGDRTTYGDFAGQVDANPQRGVDVGGASRFFYVAKADKSERVKVDGIAHPTVKPLDIMRWLVRLVTPPGGTVLEPFAGSGTTVEACILEGFHCLAIEREADYLPLIVQRINRRRDPVAAVKAAGDDGGLFDLLGEASA